MGSFVAFACLITVSVAAPSTPILLQSGLPLTYTSGISYAAAPTQVVQTVAAPAQVIQTVPSVPVLKPAIPALAPNAPVVAENVRGTVVNILGKTKNLAETGRPGNSADVTGLLGDANELLVQLESLPATPVPGLDPALQNSIIGSLRNLLKDARVAGNSVNLAALAPLAPAPAVAVAATPAVVY